MLTYLLLALLLPIIGLVISKVREIIQQYKCLDDHTIHAFMTGRLRKDTKAYDQAIAHLGLCEKCQEKLHNFDEKKPIEDHLIDN
ncbi:MAG: hypothetical protein AAFP19_25340 [Bacteroidota bacterium]